MRLCFAVPFLMMQATAGCLQDQMLRVLQASGRLCILSRDCSPLPAQRGLLHQGLSGFEAPEGMFVGPCSPPGETLKRCCSIRRAWGLELLPEAPCPQGWASPGFRPPGQGSWSSRPSAFPCP